jgi:hypothetical protein
VAGLSQVSTSASKGDVPVCLRVSAEANVDTIVVDWRGQRRQRGRYGLRQCVSYRPLNRLLEVGLNIKVQILVGVLELAKMLHHCLDIQKQG